MSRPRSELSTLLHSIMGSNNVYYQPPENTKMTYPCLRYNLNNDWGISADDKKYINKKRYTLMIIDKDPDSEFCDKIAELPFCSFDRCYTSDNLNHFVYTIYF